LRYPSSSRFRAAQSQSHENASSMKMFVASVLTTILIVALTLGAMFFLVQATEYVTSLESPLQRAAAMGAEMLFGVVLLLGTVWIATHLAVRIFTPKESPFEGGPVV
jgi:heme/copper-type cytochrome/quinol oxidase subunit 3